MLFDPQIETYIKELCNRLSGITDPDEQVSRLTEEIDLFGRFFFLSAEDCDILQNEIMDRLGI